MGAQRRHANDVVDPVEPRRQQQHPWSGLGHQVHRRVEAHALAERRGKSGAALWCALTESPRRPTSTASTASTAHKRATKGFLVPARTATKSCRACWRKPFLVQYTTPLELWHVSVCERERESSWRGVPLLARSAVVCGVPACLHGQQTRPVPSHCSFQPSQPNLSTYQVVSGSAR